MMAAVLAELGPNASQTCLSESGQDLQHGDMDVAEASSQKALANGLEAQGNVCHPEAVFGGGAPGAMEVHVRQ